jgi:Fe-coproporphyrin III synthase
MGHLPSEGLAAGGYLMKFRHYLGALSYAFQIFVLKRKLPYLVGMVITDHCNLACFYCNSSGRFQFSYHQAKDALLQAYKRGNRTLYFTGGEPMIWQDGTAHLSDIVHYAHKLGFQEIFIFTNGTIPLTIPHCSYIVTIDGPKHIHEQIRQNSYTGIIDNVRQAVTSKIFASITVTQANAAYLDDYVKEICALDIFCGISFNFLTQKPEIVRQYGFLPGDRTYILDKIWGLKQAGYPIVLSRAAYLAMRNNDWRRPIRQIELCTPDKTYTCCRDVGNPEVCVNCGYANCVEVSQILDLKPSAIMQVLKMT